MSEPLLEPLFRKLRFEKVMREIKPGSVVVDIGCGHTPRFLNRLEHYIKKGVGLDQFAVSSARGKIRLISVLLDKKIPLKTGFADHVTLIAVLEHLQQPEALLAEAYRVLKPGGTVLITVPTPFAKPVLEFLSYGLKIVSRREIAEHQRYYWKKDLLPAVRKAGFKKIKHRYFEFYWNNFACATKP